MLKKLIFVLLVFAGLLWAGATAVFSTSINGTAGPLPPPEPAVSLVADGFNQPVDIANAGDDRLFIVERDGLIRIIDADSSVVATPFLDINGRVDSSSHGERGLLGLAFHPDYPNTPYFYVNYTSNSGDTTVSRFSVTGDPYVADPTSEQILLTIDQPFRNHNGGDLNFGVDGYLYIATGDGGSGGDPDDYGQNNLSLLGKILRIDVDSGSPYGIPSDNPFVDDPNARDEIWATGLRNPWRFSFDRDTNDMYIGDVGQGQWEEVNYAPGASMGGENYGWRCYEGFQEFNTTDCGDADDYVMPLDDYPHSDMGNANDIGFSVTGGFVYRGADYQDLQGYYIYGDFVTANIWLAKQNGDNWDVMTIGTIENLSNVSTFGEGCDGELYVADYGGEIFQMVTSFTPVPEPTPTPGPFLLYIPNLSQGSEPPAPPLGCWN